MLDRIEARDPAELLLPISRRHERGVFFLRLAGTGVGVKEQLWAFHEAAVKRGVILEGRIPNPDERQLAYLTEQLGTAFAIDTDFLEKALSRWMPRMTPRARGDFAAAFAGQLEALRASGKTESILRNIYMKLMCWLYFRFERLLPFLGEDDPPRILYECSDITLHELIMLRLLNEVGSDVLLLEPAGDEGYRKHDPQSRYSQLAASADRPFPEGFTIKQLRRECASPAPRPDAGTRSAPHTPAPGRSAVPARPPVAPQARRIDPEAYFPAPRRVLCTNAWMDEPEYTQLLRSASARGAQPDTVCNAFIRMRGVREKQSYATELLSFYQKLIDAKRTVVVLDRPLPDPTPDEIGEIRRRPSYRTAEELIVDLANGLPVCADTELQRMLQRAFVHVMTEAARTERSLNRLTVAAVYLLCRARSYREKLFRDHRSGELPCFIQLGGCENASQAQFVQFLSELPVDVLVLVPELSQTCLLASDRLLELDGPESLELKRFPTEPGALRMTTVASEAEAELTGTLYADSGLYRNHQFARAQSIILNTTADELFLLWDQELKYRAGFSASGETVNVPVIYAKLSGVEHGDLNAYWQRMKKLTGKTTRFYPNTPMLAAGSCNAMQPLALKALRNGRLQREVLRQDPRYPFTVLREELQAHILDKLQLMLDRRLIKGTFENGTEYTVVATVLSMDRELVRLLQSFDFTKTNPKLVCVSTREQNSSPEDAILMTFLSLAGLDVVQLVPTGYRTTERYLNDMLPVEHQLGDYMYDLTVPDPDRLPPAKGGSWLANLFRRG